MINGLSTVVLWKVKNFHRFKFYCQTSTTAYWLKIVLYMQYCAFCAVGFIRLLSEVSACFHSSLYSPPGWLWWRASLHKTSTQSQWHTGIHRLVMWRGRGKCKLRGALWGITFSASPLTLGKVSLTKSWSFCCFFIRHFLFFICSGQWIRWQWPGFFQWWWGVEQWQLEV